MDAGMDLEFIKSFVVLAETKNFTVAAKKVSRTQSAISLQVKRLEQELGKSLFIRNNRHVELSADGEIFLSYAKQLLTLQQEVVNRLKHPEEAGEVRLGTPEDFATAYLPDILGRFAAEHPMIALTVHCELTIRLQEGFENGLHDLVIIKQDASLGYPNAQKLWSEPLFWVSSASRLRDLQLKKNLDQEIPLVLSPAPCVYRKRAIDALNEVHQRWRIAYTSPSMAGAIAAVKAGLGWTVLPLHMIPKGLIGLKDPLLPLLKDTEWALVIQPNAPIAVYSLANYIIKHVR